MKNRCQPGDSKQHQFIVKSDHFPEFKTGVVHKVCSTYDLVREIEWSARQFVLDMLDEDEEGIGTMVHIDHVAPAFEGEEVFVKAKVESFNRNELICTFIAKTTDRVVATGKTGQKILKSKDLIKVFSRYSN